MRFQDPVSKAVLRTLTGPLMLIAAFAALPGFAQPAPAILDVDGPWRGQIEVPGSPLKIDVDLQTGPDGSLSGDISIPIQGVQDLALTDLARNGNRVSFKILGLPGDPAFDGTLTDDGDRLEGTFSQGGSQLPFVLTRGDRPAAAARAALEGFDGFVEQAVADWNVPGVGLAVVAGGEVVFAQGFGYRDLENQLPMTADSLFAIGSTTKAFTTTVLGMLVDDGRVDWDQPVRDYLPGFRLQDPVATNLMTPRDLVTHRSGLPRHDRLWYNYNEGTRGEMVARLAHLEPSAALRERFQYNNLMYLTAGHLIEELTGTSWEEAVRERLLTPLGMERTTFRVDDSQGDADHALPYRRNDDDELERIPFRRIDLVGPAGSLNSSVREMSHWLRFNLARGRVDDRGLINPGTLGDIHAPHMITGTAPTRPEIQPAGYGLGWGVSIYRGHRRIAHGGGIDGFITSVMLFPDDGLGLVAFTNRIAGLPEILNQHAADRVLGLEPIDWNAEALEERPQIEAAQDEAEAKAATRRRAGTTPSHPLEEYAGLYRHPGYGLLRIDLADDRLTATFNGIATPLEHWHFDVWSGGENEDDPTFEGQKFLFRSDVDGNIAAVESTLEPQVAAIVFAKEADPRLSDPEYLRRFAGTYELPGQKVTVELSGDALTLSLPGQPQYTLKPRLQEFVLAEVPAISIAFQVKEDGEVEGMTFYEPDGVFEAKRVP